MPKSIIIVLSSFLAISCFTPVISHALLSIKEGDAPKEFRLNDIDGKAFDLTDYFGKKPVILLFWKLMKNKSFLDYSLDELIFLEDFRQKFHEKSGLEIFGIYVPQDDKKIDKDEIEAVKDTIKVNKIRFPVLIDRGLEIFKEYGVIALPSTIMIDKTGKIMFIYPSFPSTAGPVLSEQIMDLVGLAGTSGKKDAGKRKGPGSQSSRFYHYSLQMYKKGLSEQAMSPLKKSIELDPDYPWSHNLMGVILSHRGRFEDASTAFMRAIQLDRNNATAHFNYALLLFDTEKYKDAEKHLKRSLSLDTGAEAQLILGMLYRRTGKSDLALTELEAVFEEVVQKRADFKGGASDVLIMSALHTLSELYAEKGDEKKALSALRKAMDIILGLEGRTDRAPLHRGRDFMMYE